MVTKFTRTSLKYSAQCVTMEIAMGVNHSLDFNVTLKGILVIHSLIHAETLNYAPTNKRFKPQDRR